MTPTVGLIFGLLVLAADVPMGFAEVLVLKGGASLTGLSHSVTDGHVVWETVDGERLEVPFELIQRLDLSCPDFQVEDPDNSGSGDTSNEAEQAGAEEVPTGDAARAESVGPGSRSGYFVTAWHSGWESASNWTKRLEFGGRFLDGNSDDDFLDVGGEFEQENVDHLYQIEFGGEYGQSKAERQTNRWYGNATFDFTKQGKWILFVTSKNEYDEFENLDYRGTLSGGLGYRFVNEKHRRVTARVGPAVTHEIYRDPKLHRATPDVFAELQSRWPVRGRTRFENKVTLRPSIDDLDVFRLTSDSGLLFLLDNHDRWKLKLGFGFDYNSQPNLDRLKTDYTTTISLVYTRD